MTDGLVTELAPSELASSTADPVLSGALRWEGPHVLGEQAFAKGELAAARAALVDALAVADDLSGIEPLVGLPLYALTAQRLPAVLRALGEPRAADEIAWGWLERVLGLVETSRLALGPRVDCLGWIDAPLGQVLADRARQVTGPRSDDDRRVRAALARIRRASDAVARASRGEPPLS